MGNMMGERMRRGHDERVGILRRLQCRFGGRCEGIYPLGLMGTGFVTPCRRCGRVRYVMGPDEVDVQPKPLAEKVKPRLGEPERLARVARLRKSVV